MKIELWEHDAHGDDEQTGEHLVQGTETNTGDLEHVFQRDFTFRDATYVLTYEVVFVEHEPA